MLRAVFVLFLFFTLGGFTYSEMGVTIELPKPKEKGNLSLEEAIQKRHSQRNLSGTELNLEQVSQLLWACQGITDAQKHFRAAPSAGATYPLEIFLVDHNGIFQYVPLNHTLKKIRSEDVRDKLSLACFEQGFVRGAAVVIVITADFSRTTGYYGDRGRIYVYLEAGHAAQNLQLQAVSENLGSVAVGAFSNREVQEALGIPETLTPIYIIPVGYVVEE